MMEVSLTWDLVLLSGFTLLFAYSFLLGQNSTIKLILSIYIAIMTADGLAKILKDFVIDPSPGFQDLLGSHEESIYVWMRIILFLAAVITFVVKSGFHISLKKHDHWAARLGIHSVFSALSAILFLSTILIYISGNSFVEGMLYAKDIQIYKQSLIAQLLIDYYQIWFSLPAMAFLATSFLFENELRD
jgi:hypothetical protein